MMSPKLLQEAMAQGVAPQFSTEIVLHMLGHSLLLGVILGLITYAKLSMLNKQRSSSSIHHPIPEWEQTIGLVSDCSSIVFLCVGLSGIMILVNNNLARAFAIGAGIALVRMRINMGKEHAGPNLLFGVIAGIACGLGELNVAWASTFIYLVLQAGLLGAVALISWSARRQEAAKQQGLRDTSPEQVSS